MSFKKNISNFFTQPDDEEDNQNEVYAPETDTKPISKYEKAVRKNENLKANIIIFEPRSFDETIEIAKRLKEKNAVMVNLRKLSTDYKQRVIDFLQGVTYGLNGQIKHVDVDSILCTPDDVGIDGDISNDSNESGSQQL